MFYIYKFRIGANRPGCAESLQQQTDEQEKTIILVSDKEKKISTYTRI